MKRELSALENLDRCDCHLSEKRQEIETQEDCVKESKEAEEESLHDFLQYLHTRREDLEELLNIYSAKNMDLELLEMKMEERKKTHLQDLKEFTDRLMKLKSITTTNSVANSTSMTACDHYPVINETLLRSMNLDPEDIQRHFRPNRLCITAAGSSSSLFTLYEGCPIDEYLDTPASNYTVEGCTLVFKAANEKGQLVCTLEDENEKLKKENEKLRQELTILKQTYNSQKTQLEYYETKSRDLNAKIAKLAKSIECPVCLKPPNSDKVPICQNGHITCLECKRKLCPVCRCIMTVSANSLGTARLHMYSPIALQIASEIVQHSCRNEVHGCPRTGLKNTLRSHEMVCLFNCNLPCPSPVCNNLLSIMTVKEHTKACACIQRPFKSKVTLGQNLEFKATSLGEKDCIRLEIASVAQIFLVKNTIDKQTVFYVRGVKTVANHTPPRVSFDLSVEFGTANRRTRKSAFGNVVGLDMSENFLRNRGHSLEFNQIIKPTKISLKLISQI